MADLKINISADIGNTAQQVEVVKKEVVELGKDAEVSTRKIENMGKGLIDLSKTAVTASQATAKLNPFVAVLPKKLEEISIASKKAGASLVQTSTVMHGLGDVAQVTSTDLGNVVSTVIPLVSNLKSLHIESGNTARSVGSLASSFVGSGGLGIALAAIGVAFTLYKKFTDSSTDATNNNKKAIQLSVDAYDKFGKELEQVTSALGTESAKVSVLFSALSEANIGLRERKGILEQLNQISPGYLGNLDKEKAGYQEIAKAVFAYTDSLAKSAEIKALLPQVDKLFQSLINAQVQLNQLRRFQGTKPGEPGFFGLSEEDFKVEETRLLNSIKSFMNQIKIAKAGLENFAGGALSLSEILFGKTPELSKPAKELKAKAEKAFKAMEHVFGKTIHLKTAAEILFDLQQVEKEANDKLGKVKMIPIKLQLDEGEVIRRAREIAIQVEGINEQMALTVRDTMNAAFASIGESIAESLGSGADFGKTVFGNLFKVLGAGIKQMGEAMIAMGTAKIAIEKFQFAPGIGTILAGIAVVALGALLQKAIPGFAAGVTNFAGGLAMVGERGREIVRLPRGSDVIPNNRLGGIGSATQVFIPDIRLRGSDLVVAFARASQTIGRNG